MPKPRRKKSKIYFGAPAQEAIIEYNNSTDEKVRSKIYEERIKFPFEKLAENVLNTFKFSYFDVSKKDIGFNSDFNKVSVIDQKGNIKIIPKNKKSFIANKIAQILLDKLIDDRNIN